MAAVSFRNDDDLESAPPSELTSDAFEKESNLSSYSEADELPGFEVELDYPSVITEQPIRAGSTLHGKAYLCVFDPGCLESSEVKVHVEVEGASWCSSQIRPCESVPLQSKPVTVQKRRSIPEDSPQRKCTSYTFTDDDYPKTYHFLHVETVWPKAKRGSKYFPVDQDGNRDEGDVISDPAASPAKESKQPALGTVHETVPSPQNADSYANSTRGTSSGTSSPSTAVTPHHTRRRRDGDFGRGASLHVGRHVWNYRCDLDPALPSSVEVLCKDGAGGVRYRLRAVLTIAHNGEMLSRVSPWTPVLVEKIVDVPPHLSEVPQECILHSTESKQLHLPWSSYCLVAGLRTSGCLAGSCIPVGIHLSRPNGSSLKHTNVQAELVQRITLNLGGKSLVTTPTKRLGQSSKPVHNGGLRFHFHSLHTDSTADCEQTPDIYRQLTLHVPHTVIPSFRLPRISVEYYVEVKLRHNFGGSKKSIVIPLFIGTADDPSLDSDDVISITPEDSGMDSVSSRSSTPCVYRSSSV